MILIGNGPLPFAIPGTGTQSLGAPSRTSAVQQGAAQPATIPAASAERCGENQSAPNTVTSQAALRPVLATSRLDPTETDPEALIRRAGTETCPSAHEFLDRRGPPVPPLRSYAAVPTEITAEIQRLRQENAELKAQLASTEKMESEEAKEEPSDMAAETDGTPRGKPAPAEFARDREESPETSPETVEQVSEG